jgi:hypothetical protein
MKIKKVLAILMSVALILSLTACDREKSDPEVGGNNNRPSQSQGGNSENGGTQNQTSTRYREVIPLQYDWVDDFHDGLAVVCLDGEVGVIDKSGNIIVPFGKYENITYFLGGIAMVTTMDYEVGFIDSTGKEIVPLGKYGWESIESSNDFFTYEGLVPVALPIWGDNGMLESVAWGFIDNTGNEVVPPIYDRIYPFSDGLAMVTLDGKFGFVDINGDFIVPLGRYDGGNVFSEGVAVVSRGDETFLIDNKGNEIESFSLQVPLFRNPFAGGLIMFYDTEVRKRGFIDMTGSIVTESIYDDLNTRVGDSSEGMIMVAIDEKWGFIDSTGRQVVQCKYDRVEHFSYGMARVWLNDEMGLIDKNGNYIFPLGSLSGFGGFSEGLASIEGGYIDITGNYVITGQFRHAGGFIGGVAVVKDMSNNVGLINRNGDVVVPFGTYSTMRDVGNSISDRGGTEGIDIDMMAVERDGKWGFIAIG